MSSSSSPGAAPPASSSRRAFSASPVPPTSPVCPVCTLPFSPKTAPANVPKMLLCGHSVCSTCAGRLEQGVEGNTSLRCPICRELTPSAAAQLETNFALIEVIASTASAAGAHAAAAGLQAIFGPPPKAAATAVPPSPLPTQCVECEQEVPAVYCDVCKTGYCGACFARTHASKSLQQHKTLSIGEKRQQQERCCRDHGHPLLGYCDTDRVLVCIDCALFGAHKGHMVRAAREKAERTRAALWQHAERLANCTAQLQVAANKVEAVCKELEDSKDDSSSDVESHFEELEWALQKRKEHLTRRMRETLMARINTLATHRDRLEGAAEAAAAAAAAAERAQSDNDVTLLLGDALGRAQTALAQAAKHSVWMGLHVDDVADVNFVVPTDGALLEAIESYGSVGGPEAPMLAPINERQDVTSSSVRIRWWALAEAEVYEVEICTVAEALAERRAAELRKQGRDRGVAAAMMVAGMAKGDRRGKFKQAYRGEATEATLGGLAHETKHCVRVRGLNADGAEGLWSETQIVETKSAPMNTFMRIRVHERTAEEVSERMRAAVGSDRMRLACEGSREDDWHFVAAEQTMAVRAGSGQMGFFEGRVVSGTDLVVGLTTLWLGARMPGPPSFFGDVPGTLGWHCGDGMLHCSELPSGTPVHTGIRTSIGDRAGLLVDCRGAPALRLYLNGLERWSCALPLGEGNMVRPGISAKNGKIVFEYNPPLPPVQH